MLIKKKKLFGITYAGGTAKLFSELYSYLEDSVECISTEYAGHGTRAKEPFYDTWDEMVSDIANQINGHLREDDDFALFGYSMGSAVVYELLAQNLLKRQPVHIFLAGHEAPDVEWEAKQYFKLSDRELLAVLSPKGGFRNTDSKMLERDAFRRIYFEPMRNDYRLLGQYRMSRRIRFSAPATLFFSPDDIPAERMHSWDSFLSEGSEFVELTGNHFFIQQHAERMAEIVRKGLLKADL